MPKSIPFVPAPLFINERRDYSVYGTVLPRNMNYDRRKAMVKRKSKAGNMIVAFLAFAIIMSITIIPAMASNWQDTAFIFDFGGSRWKTTEMRIKEDDSYVYMNCQYSEDADDYYDAYVWGWNSQENIRFETGGPYRFYERTVLKMTNYVYENDGDYAYIRADHTGDGNGYFTGLWSPDSI